MRIKQVMHGWSRTSEYGSWRAMLYRCLNPKSESFRYYGLKGIGVCERWRASFVDFLADMGPKPTPKHSLDRIDSSKGYEPGNVRWATPFEQAQHTRSIRRITIGGVTKTVPEWSRQNGISVTTIHTRLFKGWSETRAVMEPPWNCGQRCHRR